MLRIALHVWYSMYVLTVWYSTYNVEFYPCTVRVDVWYSLVHMVHMCMILACNYNSGVDLSVQFAPAQYGPFHIVRCYICTCATVCMYTKSVRCTLLHLYVCYSMYVHQICMLYVVTFVRVLQYVCTCMYALCTLYVVRCTLLHL